MRNLKRALSLALASIMVLGMMVVGASATSYSDFSDGEKIVNKEAVSVLTTLNVINGKDDGSYDPEGIVTRAEMAKMICVVLNGGKDPQLGAVVTDTYTDTASHWAKPFIEYCSNLGIVAGRGNGTFDPNGTVTVAEAAKMLLVAVGYNATIEGYVGASWQINTDVKANQEDLYEGLNNVNTSEGLTRDNAAQMVYNALECQMVKYEYVVQTDGSIVTTKPQVTSVGLGNVLEEKFGAVKVEAVVVSNEYADLNNSYTASEDEGETYLDVKAISNSKQVNSSVPQDEDWKTADGIYDISTSKDLLGQRVVLYVRYKDTVGYDEKDAVVIGTPIPVGKNKVVKSVDGTELQDLLDDNKLETGKYTEYYANFAGAYGENTLMYGDVDGKKMSDKDNSVTTMTKAEFEAYCELTGVTVTLIDNDGDKTVDYALAEKYSFGTITKYDTKDEKIRVQGVFSEGDYKFENVVGVDAVAKDDLVLFTEYGGKLYVQKPESIEGKLDAYSTSKKTVRVDAETYDWSGLYGTVNSMYDMQTIGDYVTSDGILDTSATYYKDNNGYIIAVGEADESQFSYAVLLGYENKSASTVGSIGKTCRAELLLSDGTSGIYDVATIDGDKISNVVGFTAADVNTIFSYTKNDAGQMRLIRKMTDSSDKDTATDTVKYERGKATIYFDKSGTTNDKNYTITENTVFLYQGADGKTYHYVGRTAPSIVASEGTTTPLSGVDVAIKANGRSEALVVYIDRAPINDFEDNFIFIYNKKVTENDKGYEVQAIKDGVIDTYIISSATAGVNTVIKEGWFYNPTSGKNEYGHYIDEADLGLYNYSDEDDNTLSLKKSAVNTSTADAVSGTVEPAGKSYIRVGGQSFLRTADTKTFYAKFGKTAQEDVTVSVNDDVVMVVNDDDEILYVFVTEWGSDKDGTQTPSADGNYKKANIGASSIIIDHYGANPVSVKDYPALIMAEDKDIESVKVLSSGSVEVTYDGMSDPVTYGVSQQRVYALTVDGAISYHAAGSVSLTGLTGKFFGVKVSPATSFTVAAANTVSATGTGSYTMTAADTEIKSGYYELDVDGTKDYKLSGESLSITLGGNYFTADNGTTFEDNADVITTMPANNVAIVSGYYAITVDNAKPVYKLENETVKVNAPVGDLVSTGYVADDTYALYGNYTVGTDDAAIETGYVAVTTNVTMDNGATTGVPTGTNASAVVKETYLPISGGNLTVTVSVDKATSGIVNGVLVATAGGNASSDFDTAAKLFENAATADVEIDVEMSRISGDITLKLTLSDPTP